MFWETLNFTKSKPVAVVISGLMYGGMARVKQVVIPHEFGHDVIGNRVFIGIDPGVHFGATYITKDRLTVLWGNLPKLSNFVGLESREIGRAVARECLAFGSYMTGVSPDDVYVYIEGPAFAAQFGQTKLEQARFGFVLGFEDLVNIDHIKYIAPASARKIAFGDGKKAGKDIWLNINENGADSVGVALSCLLSNT